MKKPKHQKQASDFWMEDYFDHEHQEKGDDIMELSSYRRAVANFVRIVTGDNIPVKFSTGNDSYTNGKEVTISASTKLQDRDSMVGLALHEGSHIKLTDFKLLYRIQQYWSEFECHQHKPDHYALSEHNWFTVNGYTEQLAEINKYDGYWYGRLKDMINYVEDRRIDAFIAKSAPGYRPYYQALYDKYFNSKVIDKGLQSADFRTEDWDSYLFRLMNITNPKRDLKALKQLEVLWHMLDLKNISRLKSTDDAAKLAFEMLHVISCSIGKLVNNTQSSSSSPEGQQPEEQDGPDSNGQSPISSDDDNHDLPDQDPMQAPGSGGPGIGDEDDNVNDDEDDADTQDNLDSLSDKEQHQLRKKIEEQRQLASGQLKKKRVSKKLADMINSIDDSNISIESVCTGVGEFKVTVIRSFNRKLAETVEGGMWNRNPDRRITEAVNAGIQQGTVLGKKLKVRAEERSTQFNRQRVGKLDKRMIHTAGFGNETIFDRIEKFSYRPGIIHISIDNSGSMNGRKYEQAMQTAAAIAKACSMIPNMDCVINMRSSGSIGNAADTAMIVVAYDSRRQSINEMRVLLPYIWCCGSTPEGLCFDAIMKDIIKSANGKDAFFLNFSDGAPFYHQSSVTRGYGHGGVSYSGTEAHLHTRKQVQKMMAEGIHVLSYFISDYERNEDHSEVKNFREMYGRESQFINVQDINAIAKTINNKFLEVA
jgi:hypothetical protein